MKLQVSNEKVIVNVQQILGLIKEVRALTLMHDDVQLRQESKVRSDEVRRVNKHEMNSLAERISEAETLREEVRRELEGLM